MGLIISKALPGLRAWGLVHMTPSQGPQGEQGSAPAQGQPPNTQGSEMAPMSPEGSPVTSLLSGSLSHLVFLVSGNFAKGLLIRLCLPGLCTQQARPGAMEAKRPDRWTALLSHCACQLNFPGHSLLMAEFTSFFLYCSSFVVCVLVAQSCLTLCHSMDCSPPGSSVPEIFQARLLEWVAISFSRGSSQPRD